MRHSLFDAVGASGRDGALGPVYGQARQSGDAAMCLNNIPVQRACIRSCGSQVKVEEAVRSTGFYRNKTKNILGAAKAVLERSGGKVPASMEDLVTIPVGRT